MMIGMQRVMISLSLAVSAFVLFRLHTVQPSSIIFESSQTTIPQTWSGDMSIVGLQNSIVDAIRIAGPSVVNIIITRNLQIYMTNPFRFWERGEVVERQQRVGGGSGIFVTKDGLVMTNKHVVSDVRADYTVVTSDGTLYRVQNVWLDPVIDIAFLQIVDENGNKPTDLIPAQFVSFDEEVRVGQFAIAIGNALSEYQDSVTMGIVSAKNRKLETNANDSLYVGLLQTDTPINPGNSGGPLLDIFGRVVGVNTAIAGQGMGIGFAIPVTQEFVNASIATLHEFGEIRRPLLGIGHRDITRELAQELGLQRTQGTLIEQIVPGSPAEQAGLEVGDIILAVNNRPIKSELPFLYHMYQHRIGDEVTIVWERNGQAREAVVRLSQAR
ncbi:MAG: trypsin-like peptidase domain-containing protein [Candidatus Absconditabacterales bacterium]|nr:trypsin-like peptidase domain-containing protein [Candidatus Absconditabacterales bacterium]